MDKPGLDSHLILINPDFVTILELVSAIERPQPPLGNVIEFWFLSFCQQTRVNSPLAATRSQLRELLSM